MLSRLTAGEGCLCQVVVVSRCRAEMPQQFLPQQERSCPALRTGVKPRIWPNPAAAHAVHPGRCVCLPMATERGIQLKMCPSFPNPQLRACTEGARGRVRRWLCPVGSGIGTWALSKLPAWDGITTILGSLHHHHAGFSASICWIFYTTTMLDFLYYHHHAGFSTPPTCWVFCTNILYFLHHHHAGFSTPPPCWVFCTNMLDFLYQHAGFSAPPACWVLRTTSMLESASLPCWIFCTNNPLFSAPICWIFCSTTMLGFLHAQSSSLRACAVWILDVVDEEQSHVCLVCCYFMFQWLALSSCSCTFM